MRNLHLTFVLCSDSQNIWTLTDRISMESILKDMVLFDWLTMLKLLHIHSQFSTGIKFWKIEHCEWYNMKEFHFDVKRLHAMGWNNCWMNHSLSLLHLCFHKKIRIWLQIHDYRPIKFWQIMIRCSFVSFLFYYNCNIFFFSDGLVWRQMMVPFPTKRTPLWPEP